MATSCDEAQSVNPYAPSAIPQPLAPNHRGIGVWRDGLEIVLHPQATLPRHCIVTGEPARFGYYLKIAWSRRFDLTPRTLGLYIPLSAKVHFLCRKRRLQTIGSVLAACSLLALSLLRYDVAGGCGIGASLAILFVVAFAAWYVYVQYSQFLYFTSLEGEYLRLKGADERFLRWLPEWTA
jgi:hypothetical protein